MHLSVKAAAVLLAAATLCAAQEAPRELRVEFEGNRVFTSEQLRNAVTQCAERMNGEAFDAEVLDYCLRKDALDLMRRAGYVTAGFGETRTTSLGGVVTVTVPVEEKEFYRVGRITVERAEHFDAKSLREMLPLKRGDIADPIAVGRWAYDHLKVKYADEGFIQYEVNISPGYRIAPGAPEGVQDFTVTITEGKRFTLRRLVFKIAGGAPEDAARGAMLVREGETFSARKFAESIERLNDLHLFDAVDSDRDAEFSVSEETGELDITIRLAGDAAGG